MIFALVAALAVQKPNIVFILADDIGYGDFSCYGATKVKTPNVDLLAKQGARFTDGHSPSAVCTPTRYSLLTGEYAMRNPKANQVISGVAPLTIALDKLTMPKMLQHQGYTTGIVGKWHLGLGPQGSPTDYTKPIILGPNQVGFDYSFIMPATGDRVPCVYVENGHIVNDDPNDPVLVSYRTKIGNEPTGKEHPELLKVKLNQGHDGTIINGVSRIGFMSGGTKARWVDEDMADTYVKKAVSFIGKNRSKPFFLYFATHDVHAPQLPNHRFDGQSQCGLRGDTIREFDWSVGEVLKALRKNGLDKNTIVVVTSDNGAVENDGYGDPRENLNGHKVNGVLRGEKYSPYEGGHRIPLIVRWPGQIKPGTVSPALVSHTDFFRSLATLTGAQLGPRDARDSEDMFASLLHGGAVGRSSLLYHVGGELAAWRSGPWVLIPDKKAPTELYNVVDDLSEKRDLAREKPEVVSRLDSEFQAKLKDIKGG